MECAVECTVHLRADQMLPTQNVMCTHASAQGFYPGCVSLWLKPRRCVVDRQQLGSSLARLPGGMIRSVVESDRFTQ
jgi:hypothetical protein